MLRGKIRHELEEDRSKGLSSQPHGGVVFIELESVVEEQFNIGSEFV